MRTVKGKKVTSKKKAKETETAKKALGVLDKSASGGAAEAKSDAPATLLADRRLKAASDAAKGPAKGKPGRPATKNAPEPVAGDPRSEKVTVDGGVWIEGVEAPVEALAFLDMLPQGFARVATEEGASVVAMNFSNNPVYVMATTGRRRLTQTQIEAGYRLMSDMMAMHTTGSNMAAVLQIMEKAPVLSAHDRNARAKAERMGTGYGVMKTGPANRPTRDFAQMKLDAALRLKHVRAHMSRVGWYFVEEICGNERSPAAIATRLDESVAYCDVRAREALSELAAAYAASDAEIDGAKRLGMGRFDK